MEQSMIGLTVLGIEIGVTILSVVLTQSCTFSEYFVARCLDTWISNPFLRRSDIPQKGVVFIRPSNHWYKHFTKMAYEIRF